MADPKASTSGTQMQPSFLHDPNGFAIYPATKADVQAVVSAVNGQATGDPNGQAILAAILANQASLLANQATQIAEANKVPSRGRLLASGVKLIGNTGGGEANQVLPTSTPCVYVRVSAPGPENTGGTNNAAVFVHASPYDPNNAETLAGGWRIDNANYEGVDIPVSNANQLWGVSTDANSRVRYQVIGN